VRSIQGIKVTAQDLFVGDSETSRVVCLLEQVSGGAQVPRYFLTLPVESVLAFLPSAVVINFLESGVLFDFGQDLTVFVCEMVHKDLGNLVCLIHLLGKFLGAHLLANLVEVNCCHFD
jgi:hypothetical protein